MGQKGLKNWRFLAQTSLSKFLTGSLIFEGLLSVMTFLPMNQSQHQAQQQGLPERHDPRHLLLGNLDLSPSVHMCGDLAHTEVRTALAVCLRRVLPRRRLLTYLFVKTYKL